MPPSPPSLFFDTYKYKLLAGTYLGVTALLCYRVRRQPYTPAIKWGQYETIFKGTSLSAVVGGVLMNSGGQRRYTMYRDRGGGDEVLLNREWVATTEARNIFQGGGKVRKRIATSRGFRRMANSPADLARNPRDKRHTAFSHGT